MRKSNEFYHSSVEIIEHPFEKIYLDELNEELIKNINLFNSSKDIKEKQNLINFIPIEFPICRFCGEKIINSNFYITYNIKQKYIQLYVPYIYCREIDHKKYYLSCCENCLLKHFEDNPPKAQKYYFMKANKYGQYCYGYSDEEYHKICSMTVAVTHNSMIKKWGKELGEQKWKEYRDKQSLTNKFEYKKEKYGWDKDKFNEFNKSRAITKKNQIIKYGEELGEKYFNDYVRKQQITKSKEYMINKYGEERTKEINKTKAQTLENYIKRLGEEEGLKQYELMLSHHTNYFSKISQKFFDEIDKYISQKYTTYYATKNNEYGINLHNSDYIRLDYFILELNLCIEFNGTYFHADPRFFNENDYPNPHNKVLTAKEIWENDNNRYKRLKECRNIDTVVVWEYDYNNGIDVQKFIKEQLNISL
jgi:hypothetical protein